MKESVCGGASIVFCKYHEAGITRIERAEYRDGEWDLEKIKDRKTGELVYKIGKKVKQILGFDANALYPCALGMVIPCGILKRVECGLEIIKEVETGKFFGFVKCDLEVPKHLYNYFSEMTPIFQNTEIENVEEVVGSISFNIIKKQNKEGTKEKKLIGLMYMYGKNLLKYTPKLQWLLKHGVVVTKVYHAIEAERGYPFKSFVDYVADGR